MPPRSKGREESDRVVSCRFARVEIQPASIYARERKSERPERSAQRNCFREEIPEEKEGVFVRARSGEF